MIHMQTRSRTKGLIVFFALFFLSSATISANGHYYLGGSVAASFAQLDTDSPNISYFSGALISDAYPLNKRDATFAVLSVNGGYEFPILNSKSMIALGLGVYTTPGNYKYSGNLIETVEGGGSNALYYYRYNVQSTRLIAEMQLTWKLIEQLYPFINIGAGSAWNIMSSYTEMPSTSNGYVALPPFQSHTQTNFSYQAGLGLSMEFNFNGHKMDAPRERISLGYRYTNLGGTSFGSRGAAYPYALNTGTLSTNDVYLGYTHLF